MSDNTYQTNRDGARNAGVLFGSYHFADGGDPIAEADWFVKNVGEMRNGELLVLDWEINHATAVDWCFRFLERVKEKTGVKPLLYTNEARVKSLDWKKVVNGDYGLWVAKYGANNGQMNAEPAIGQWPFLAMWQYTSVGKVAGIVGNVDMDVAFMNLDTLKAYGKKGSQTLEMKPTFKIYNQLDYKGVKFGSKKATDMGDYGCKLCSVATILQKDPVEVDRILVAGGAYFGTNGDMLDDATLAKVLGWEYLGKETDINKMPSWSPTIKEVDFSASAGKQQHFVVRIIKPDGTTAILDPYGGVERKANYYESKSNNFVSYRLFKVKVEQPQAETSQEDDMVSDLKKALEKVSGDDYGDKMNESEQKKAAKAVDELRDKFNAVKNDLINSNVQLSTANEKVNAQATQIANLEKKLSEEKATHEDTKKALEKSSGVYKLAQNAKRAFQALWDAIG